MTSIRGTKVLVTGADGFIGSHLVERLLEDGADVRALCFYNSRGSFGWLDEIAPDRRAAIDIRLGDVRDAGFVREVVGGVQTVFHLAALVAIPYSYAAPASFVETNVSGTLNVLEAVQGSGARLVHTSTSEVYGTPERLPITENHPLRAQSPYSASKIAADQLVGSYVRSYGTDAVTLRPFNTFGPRQSLRAVIPTILAQLQAGEGEVRLGSLEPRRDFTYVADTVDGFIRIASARIEPGTTVQLGTGSSISIGDLFELCRDVTGRHDAVVVTEGERVRPVGSEVQVLESDPSLARELLGWTPSTPFREGLERVSRWLLDHVEADRVVRYHR